MTDQTNNSGGAPASGTPAGNAPAPSNAAAASQRTEMQDNPRARGHSPAADARQQQQPPPEQKIKVGDAEYSVADVNAAMAERAEAASRKATLPATAADYRAELTPDFNPGEGVRFELDQNDPLLARARELAFAKGLDQSTFSSLLDLYAASKVGEVQKNMALRDASLKQLGAAAPTRIESVAVWLQARAGKDGQVMANWLRQFPAPHIVRAMESVIRAFSSQGGADYSSSHRAGAEDNAGRIPNYENLGFVGRRVAQMAQQFGPKRER